MPHGPARRCAIIEAMKLAKENDKIYVNCKWQLSTQDPDLKYLLKKGILVQRREGGIRNTGGYPFSWKNSSKRQSYLVLTGSK